MGLYKKVIRLLKTLSYYLPITVYFLLFIAIIVPGYLKLKAIAEMPDSAYTAVYAILLNVTLWFGCSMVCLALLSVCISYGFIKWQQRRGQLQIKLEAFKKPETIQQELHLRLQPALAPLMGFIKLRVRYDLKEYSPKFSPSPLNEKGSFTTWQGTFVWHLPEIREYHVDQVVLYCEDFFHFFSLALTLKTAIRFHICPQTQTTPAFKAAPRKTEETDVRIDELKRVEGEWLNYKNFETSDDVRRIVWKIYAKNKELVVRTPEVLDPYASHIYFYPSFYSFMNVSGVTKIEKPFLNAYKNACWSVYQQLQKKGFELTYLPDQTLPPFDTNTTNERVPFMIAGSHWQQEVSLNDFIKPGYASVVLLSSLNDAQEVEQWIARYGNDISFLFIPLSQVNTSALWKTWLKWIFLQGDVHENEQSNTLWKVSPLRLKLEANEKKITELLKQSERSIALQMPV